MKPKMLVATRDELKNSLSRGNIAYMLPKVDGIRLEAAISSGRVEALSQPQYSAEVFCGTFNRTVGMNKDSAYAVFLHAQTLSYKAYTEQYKGFEDWVKANLPKGIPQRLRRIFENEIDSILDDSAEEVGLSDGIIAVSTTGALIKVKPLITTTGEVVNIIGETAFVVTEEEFLVNGNFAKRMPPKVRKMRAVMGVKIGSRVEVAFSKVLSEGDNTLRHPRIIRNRDQEVAR